MDLVGRYTKFTHWCYIKNAVVPTRYLNALRGTSWPLDLKSPECGIPWYDVKEIMEVRERNVGTIPPFTITSGPIWLVSVTSEVVSLALSLQHDIVLQRMDYQGVGTPLVLTMSSATNFDKNSALNYPFSSGWTWAETNWPLGPKYLLNGQHDWSRVY